MFSADMVDTNAIGRGTTVELSIWVASLGLFNGRPVPRSLARKNTGLESIAYDGDVCAISQVFHPSSSSVFQSLPNGVFESPSPTFQSTFGGSVNLNG